MGDRFASTCGMVGFNGVSGSDALRAAKLARGTGINAKTAMLANADAGSVKSMGGSARPSSSSAPNSSSGMMLSRTSISCGKKTCEKALVSSASMGKRPTGGSPWKKSDAAMLAFKPLFARRVATTADCNCTSPYCIRNACCAAGSFSPRLTAPNGEPASRRTRVGIDPLESRHAPVC